MGGEESRGEEADLAVVVNIPHGWISTGGRSPTCLSPATGGGAIEPCAARLAPSEERDGRWPLSSRYPEGERGTERGSAEGRMDMDGVMMGPCVTTTRSSPHAGVVVVGVGVGWGGRGK